MGTNGNSTATKHKETRSPFLKADVHKVLLAAIWKIAKIHSVRSMACASKLVPRHLCQVRMSNASRNRADCDDVTLAPQCPRTMPFDTSWPWPAASMEQFGIIFDGSLSTRYEKIHGSVNIQIPKTRNTTNHEAQQHVFVERPRLPQLVHQSNIGSLCSTRPPRTLRHLLQPPHCNGKSRGVHSSNGALPTPSVLSERYFCHLVTWSEKERASRRRTQYERIRRSRLRTAHFSNQSQQLNRTTKRNTKANQGNRGTQNKAMQANTTRQTKTNNTDKEKATPNTKDKYKAI